MTQRSGNKEVVMRYVDAFNRGDLDGIVAEFHPDAQIWGVMGSGTPEQARPLWKGLIEGLEPKLDPVGVVEEGNVVAVRYVERGRSAKEFHGMGPTGKTYEVTAMEWFELADGKITRRWAARDFSAISRQLGL